MALLLAVFIAVGVGWFGWWWPEEPLRSRTFLIEERGRIYGPPPGANETSNDYSMSLTFQAHGAFRVGEEINLSGEFTVTEHGAARGVLKKRTLRLELPGAYPKGSPAEGATQIPIPATGYAGTVLIEPVTIIYHYPSTGGDTSYRLLLSGRGIGAGSADDSVVLSRESSHRSVDSLYIAPPSQEEGKRTNRILIVISGLGLALALVVELAKHSEGEGQKDENTRHRRSRISRHSPRG